MDPEVEAVEPVDSNAAGGHPWDSYLADLPDSVKPLVQPTFEKWEADTTRKFQELHSQYEPWKEFTSSVDPTYAQQAVQLAQLMETDPERVYKALQEQYKYGEQGPAGTTATSDPDDDDVDPRDARITQLEEYMGNIAQFLEGQQTQQETNQAHSALDAVMADLHTEHGAFSDKVVLTYIANGADPQQAVQLMKQELADMGYVPKTEVAKPLVPVITSGAGGGAPVGEPVDWSKASSKDTQKAIVQMLAQAAQQG